MLSVLRYLLLTVEVVTATLLIVVILLQKSKQQGAGLAFGAAVGESLFGAQVSNVLTRITVVLAIVFLITTTALAYLGASRASTTVTSGIKATPTMPVSAPGPAPTAGPAPIAAPLPAPAAAPAPAMPDPSTAISVDAVPAPAEARPNE